MAGVDTVIRLLGGTLAIIVIAFVAAVGYALVEPIYQDVIDPAEMAALGWGAPQDTILLFMGLGMIGLSIVVVVWWLVAPARRDVRQDVRRGPF